MWLHWLVVIALLFIYWPAAVAFALIGWAYRSAAKRIAHELVQPARRRQ